MADVKVTKIMALTIDDLLRLLPAVVPGVEVQLVQNRIDLLPGLIIELDQSQPTRVGAIIMPQLQLDFCFHDWQQTEIEGFIIKFDRIFQRGGG
jgi:hypothetical protein